MLLPLGRPANDQLGGIFSGEGGHGSAKRIIGPTGRVGSCNDQGYDNQPQDTNEEVQIEHIHRHALNNHSPGMPDSWRNCRVPPSPRLSSTSRAMPSTMP